MLPALSPLSDTDDICWLQRRGHAPPGARRLQPGTIATADTPCKHSRLRQKTARKRQDSSGRQSRNLGPPHQMHTTCPEAHATHAAFSPMRSSLTMCSPSTAKMRPHVLLPSSP